MTPDRDSHVQLRRVLNRRDVVAIAFGAMVGWSWVVLAGEMVVRAGAVGSDFDILINVVDPNANGAT